MASSVDLGSTKAFQSRPGVGRSGVDVVWQPLAEHEFLSELCRRISFSDVGVRINVWLSVAWAARIQQD